MPERSETPRPDPELTVLAAALRDLKLRPAGLDRDVLMFRAGRASAPRRWGWPLATGISTVLVLILGGLLVTRPASEPGVRVVYVSTPVAAPAAQEPAPEVPGLPGPETAGEDRGASPQLTYFRLQQRVLDQGLDGLGEVPPPPPGEPATLQALLRSL